MRKQFNLQEYLAHPDWKVETRNGRIVHNIWQIKEPPYTNKRRAEVCALIDGEEDALVFFTGGRYLPTTEDIDNPFDLFLVTPEPKMTEFEKACIELYQEGRDDDHFGDKLVDKALKARAAELLELARKEMMGEMLTSGPKETALYKAGLADGKAEALKDLPRWEKVSSEVSTLSFTTRGELFLFHKGYGILLKDLEKLPKEE